MAGSPQSIVDDLIDQLIDFEYDPLGFVLWAFPWGEPGTSLADEDGPEEWQREQLDRIGRRLAEGGDLGAVIEEDVAAGHGVGKSAIVSWLILWAISTKADTRGVVTANTDTQLRTKTWAELGKWHQLFVARDLFTLTATAIYSADAATHKTWRIDQIPWSKERSEAFAGLHNKGKRILVLFDEASAIDDLIWEVTEGALTDEKTQILWLRYGNPTRTTGRFHRNFTRGKRNATQRVDSRTVRFTNKAQIQTWIDEYGEDSDFVRVRVKGMFPRAGSMTFIPYDLVEGARTRELRRVDYESQHKILSIDPARYGDDSSVITLRQGLKVHWQQKMSGFDGPELAGRCVEICRQIKGIQAIIYDAVGIGADLDSSLKRAPGLPLLIPIAWGIPAKDSQQYFNQRAEAWGRMKEWLKHGMIPDDDTLVEELTGIEYGYSNAFQIQLERKDDYKKRLGRSPDCADSLALSFLVDVLERPAAARRATVRPTNQRKIVWSR